MKIIMIILLMFAALHDCL